MALPDLIEIVPITRPIQAEITVPGSKSITNRALVLAALANGEVTLKGALWSEDTQVMVDSLWKLGIEINVIKDPREPCNRTIEVVGQGGIIPNGGTESEPLDLFISNAGTAARFLAALVCLGKGVYRLRGIDRMHERPQEDLFDALRQLGYRIESPTNRLPVLIYGNGPRVGSCEVRLEKSTQFASALLLCSQRAGWEVNIVSESGERPPYVRMTEELQKIFPRDGGSFQIEPDASSGSYFLCADWLLWIQGEPNQALDQIRVAQWPNSGWQKDAEYLSRRNLHLKKNVSLSRKTDLADSIMTAIVQAPLNRGPNSGHPEGSPVSFNHLSRLRVQECERVTALKDELTRCGARVIEEDDTLKVYPSPLHGAEIQTYNDHRMAMCFATLGLKVPGIKIKNPSCVKKTFPNFFQKLATPPPQGLGTTVLNAETGRPLLPDDLFAE